MHSPTEEQLAIIEAARASNSSLMISALAGCAKTSTLTMLAPVLPTRSVLALAFNKKIATDLESVLPSHFTVSTMNSLGHRAFASATGRRLLVDASKISKLVTALSKSLGGFPDDEWANLRNMVNRARVSGIIPQKFPQSRKALLADDSWGWETVADSLSLELTEDLLRNSREILSQSIDLALQGTIDYDDQIYMSVLFSGLYPKFHTVLVDEAQDLSPLNHLQLKKVCGSRLIVVGDPRQAIYAFRGADGASMEKIRALRPDWLDLHLTTTFRCPQVIVQRQLTHAPSFKAAPSAPIGELKDLRELEDGWNIPGLVKPDAVLCRNNAPLISLAFKLIRRRIGITMLGRDFGKSLITLVKKICGSDLSKIVDDCGREVAEWQEKEIRLARANDKEERVDRIRDQAESLFAVMESADILGDVLKLLDELFSDSKGQIILSSIHKAKGLEWPVVLHLDPWRIPSKWARLARDDGDEVPYQQEMNLKYVCETRAKHTLILADLETFS